MKSICEICINNDELKLFLRSNIKNGNCSYCGRKAVGIIDSTSLIEFAGNRLIESLYSIDDATSYEKSMFFEGVDILPFQEVYYIIESYDVGHEDFAGELADYVFEASSCEDDLFIINDGLHDNNSYKRKWLDFTQSTAHKHRFFNKNAKKFLDSLFELILDNGVIKKSVIRTLDRTV